MSHVCIRWCVLGVGLLWSSADLRAQPVVPLSLVPPESQEYICLYNRAIVNSELNKKNGSLERLLLNMAEAVLGDTSEFGFDAAKDLDYLLALQPSGAENAGSRSLLIAAGRFASEKVLAAVQRAAEKAKVEHAVVKERGLPCLRCATTVGGKLIEVYVTVIDGHYALLGPKEVVLASLDRYLGKTAGEIASKEVAAALQPKDPSVVLAMNMGPKSLRQQVGVEDPAKLQLLEKITMARLIARATSTLKLELAVEAMDADTAKELKEPVSQLVTQLKGLIEIFAMNVPDAQPLAELKDNSNLVVKGKTLSFQMEISQKLIDTMAGPQKQDAAK